MGAAATRMVPRGGARVMRRRLIAALILAAPDRGLRRRLPHPRHRARQPGAARLADGKMTMLDDGTPATAQTTPEPPRPGPGRYVRGGAPSALSRQLDSRRNPLPGNAWMADSAPVNGSEWLYLPGTPWSMRLAGGSGGRPALEVHAAGSLIDVMVATSRASQLLRGGCGAVVARQACALAWGCLPTARSELPSVEFIRGRIRRRAQLEEAESVAGWFWFADTDGRFSQVVATSQEGRESCRIRTVEAC